MWLKTEDGNVFFCKYSASYRTFTAIWCLIVHKCWNLHGLLKLQKKFVRAMGMVLNNFSVQKSCSIIWYALLINYIFIYAARDNSVVVTAERMVSPFWKYLRSILKVKEHGKALEHDQSDIVCKNDKYPFLTNNSHGQKGRGRYCLTNGFSVLKIL